MIPTSIDGTDITGATIDGTDVTEITVDGQTVFSAFTPPVAASDLVAWYRFEDGTVQDYTTTFGIGDTTDYSGSDGGNQFNSSGGRTDIVTGASSGHYQTLGSNPITLGNIPDVNSNQNFTVMAWCKGLVTGNGGDNTLMDIRVNSFCNLGRRSGVMSWKFGDNGNVATSSPDEFATGNWFHMTMANGSSSGVGYINGNQRVTNSLSTRNLSGGISVSPAAGDELLVDDIRFYNRQLNQSEIQDIVQNTSP